MAKKANISEAKARAAYEAFAGKQISKTVSVSKAKGKATGKTVVKPVQIIKKVPFIVTKPVIKKVEVIKEVPVHVTKEVVIVQEVKVPVEVPVIKTVIKKVPVVKTKTVVKKVPVVKTKTVIKKVPVIKTKTIVKKDTKAIKALQSKYKTLQAKCSKLEKSLKAKPKTIIKEVEVIKEVPVEIIKEVEVVKSLDFGALQKMMKGMKTVEVSKKVIGESRTKGAGKIVERREVKGGARTRVQTKSKSSKAKKPAKTDDLTKIEGVGPAIAKLLNENGIYTYKKLADMKISSIQTVLTKGGPKFQMHTPGSWPKQADLAAKGKWKQLEKLQKLLSGGK